MRIILLMLGLLWSSCLFGQIQIDTIKTQEGYFYSSGGKSLDEVVHGESEVKKIQKRRDILVIHKGNIRALHRGDLYRNPVDINIKFGNDNDIFNSIWFYLPDDFKNGYDSVFVQLLEPLQPKYLAELYEIKDANGTATVTYFHANGKKAKEINFAGDTLPFHIYEKHNDDNQLVDKDLNPENLTVEFDTSYMKEPYMQGWEYGYYENGNIKWQTYFTENKVDSLQIEYHGNGQVKMKSHLSNKGYLTKKETWFENGQLKSTKYYKEKYERYGIWKTWYSNGQLKKQQSFTDKRETVSQLFFNGQADTIQEWYDNGQLKSIHYERRSEDRNTKDYIAYYSDGTLKVEGRYFDSYIPMTAYVVLWCNCPKRYIETEDDDFGKNGEWKYYKPNGELLLTRKYRFGALVKENTYADELVIYDYFHSTMKEHCRKQITAKVEINDDEYEEKTYCINRRIITWTDTFYNYVVNDLGDSTKYLFEIVDFLIADDSIYYQRFYPNGQKMADYRYRSEQELRKPLKGILSTGGGVELSGKAMFWYSNGNLKWERTYIRGFIMEEKIYYENGRQKSISYPNNDNATTWKTWHESGSPKETMAYFYNRKDGEYIKWNEKYMLNQRLNYKDGELHGKQFYYDNEGKLIKTTIYENGILQK